MRQDKARSHVNNKTRDYMQQLFYCGPWKMNWPGNTQDRNKMEKLGAF